MKITDIKTFLVNPGVGKNLLFVKVETDEDIYGWGESYTQADRGKVIETHINSFSRYLMGWNPFDIKKFTQYIYEEFALKRGGMDFYSAVSGIEQALWDIVGKKLDEPVYNLIGGACRDEIKVYANGWYNGTESPDELAMKAMEVVDRGFDAIKVDLFPGPAGLYISQKEESEAIERIKKVRDTVGTDVNIMVDVLRSLSPYYAIRIGRLLEKYDIYWFEEPVPIENSDALLEVKKNIKTPVVTGECLYTKHMFREIFEKQATDIINPDICNTGGILEVKEISAQAEAYYIPVAPHNYNSTTVALNSGIQIAANIPNFLILEYFLFFEDFGREISKNLSIPERGKIDLPKTPGLGIDLDERALSKLGYKEFPKRGTRMQYSRESTK
jgi:galactonate dehydratase